MPRKADYWKDPEKHRKATRQYALDNPEKHREDNRVWVAKDRAKNPDKHRAASNKYREGNPEKRVAATRTWAHARPGMYLIYNAKARATKQGVPFDITLADITPLPEFCPVLGIALELRPQGRRGFHPNSPSIDKIIPAKGYVRGNVRVISNRANCIKRDATLDELRALVAYVERETS